MKKTIAFLAIILGLTSAHAEQSNTAQSVSEMKRQLKLKQALLFLLEEGAITLPENQCPQIEQSLIDELRENGTLTTGHGPVLTSICIVPDPK